MTTICIRVDSRVKATVRTIHLKKRQITSGIPKHVEAKKKKIKNFKVYFLCEKFWRLK